MEKNVRVLIVEDEFVTLDLLRDYLEGSGYEISGDAMRTEEAIEILERFDTDIAILDINIKGNKDGIWLAEQIRKEYHIPFIFLSAYSDSSTIHRASNTNPYGYLVKPFSQADIFAAIEVALKNYSKETRQLKIPLEHSTENTQLLINDFVFIKGNSVFKKVILADIQYIQAFKNYIELCFADSRFVVRSSLQKFLNILPTKHFLLTHRSFVVNAQHIDSIGADFIMIGTNKIPMSKGHKDEVVQRFSFFY